MASLHPPSHPTSPAGAPAQGAAYVGDDWMVVVDAGADYTRSEAIAPFLLLAEPGARLDLHTAAGLLAGTNVSHHRAGSVSEVKAPAPGAAFIYFDPLSPPGRTLQAAGADITGDGTAAPAHWDAAWFKRLLQAQAQPDEVRQWLQALVRARGLHEGPGARAVDRRVRSVARRLAADAEGRLQLAELAAAVHWSAEHLRKAFAQAAGLSLSRYQMWCRITRLLGAGESEYAVGTRIEHDSASLLHAAGFYDAPHGSRVIRRYLGVSMADVTRDRHPIRPCVDRGAAPAASSRF